MIKLDDIAIFVHVVRARGLSAAARRLGMPANTVSRRLRELEVAIGTPLLQRSSRRLHCTPAGEALFARCAEGVDAMETAARDLDFSDRRVRGDVRVALSSSFAEFVGPGFFSAFLTAYPEVRLKFLVIDQEPQLVDNGIDIALRLGPIDKPSKVVRKLCNTTLGFYASEDYLREHGAPATLDELSAHRQIAFLYARSRDVWMVHGPAGVRPLQMTGQVGSDSMLAVIRAAEAGLGIALIDNGAMRTPRAGLRRVLPDCHATTDGYHAIYAGHGTLSGAARALLDYVIDATAVWEEHEAPRVRLASAA